MTFQRKDISCRVCRKKNAHFRAMYILSLKDETRTNIMFCTSFLCNLPFLLSSYQDLLNRDKLVVKLVFV